jgi:hypothetical protein
MQEILIWFLQDPLSGAFANSWGNRRCRFILHSADYVDERNNRGMVNGRGTPVGRDLSPPPPIYRPVANPPHTQMNVLKLIIGHGSHL